MTTTLLKQEQPHIRIDRARMAVILVTLALSVVTVSVVHDQPWSDGKVAAGLSFVENAIALGYLAWSRDRIMGRLLLFGLGLGIVELLADALCVRYTQTLDYSVAHSAMLWLSPWWMPSAWMLVAAQIGYLGDWMMTRFGDRRGMALTALLGAVNIPFYEEMAYHAHWWRYGNCKMIGHTPIYIIVAELLIGLTLGPLARMAMTGKTWKTAVYAGIIGGLGTIAAGLIGYGLVERIF